MNTKPVDNIIVNADLLDDIYDKYRDAEFDRQINSLNEFIRKSLTPLASELNIIFKKNRNWLKFQNKDVFYNKDVCGLFPNFYTFVVGNSKTLYQYDPKTFNGNFHGYKGDLITREEFKKVFCNNWDYLTENFGWRFGSYFTIANTNEFCVNTNGDDFCKWNGTYNYNSYHIPIFRFGNENASPFLEAKLIYHLLRNKLIPVGLSKNSENFFKYLLSFFALNEDFFIAVNDKFLCNREVLYNAVIAGELTTIDKSSPLTLSEIKNNLKKKQQSPLYGNIAQQYIQNTLLNCDKTRADIESYDEKILFDVNRGHWDIWIDDEHNNNEKSKEKIDINLYTSLIARNPELDIKHDGVIGIDFGTKSTVVVYQEDSEHSMPMRIGTGKLSKKIEASHFENPTVMEFVDIETFLKFYKINEGRPSTSWDTITTSHTAFESFITSNSDHFYSYLSDLKQWMGDKKRQIRLKDKKGSSFILPPFAEIDEYSFDPIELYAYYIGLYINNMHNGIYLDYLLSYPVTFEKSVREKMVESFKRGIKKSLPEAIIDNPSIMANFRVALGATEPMAYALCALEEYGFLTKEEDVYYGVFDFGGGTTDFDFGKFRLSNRSERRFDYVIESYGAGGDQFLGGENILELLAFDVFRNNQDILLRDSITFTLPPESKRFLGSETLISDSQEARVNVAQLMEQLRGFWEKSEAQETAFESGKVKVTLFNSNGEQKPNYELDLRPKDLYQTIYNRIDKGIRNFFHSLTQNINIDETEDVINIFLAGNSSKSAIVSEIFDKYIEEYNSKYNQRKLFEIFPPLGTDEAVAIQEKCGVATQNNSLERPTGKTGVAFGLVKSRLGGRIKIVTDKNKDEEIKFAYYIGYEKMRKFNHITDRSIDYNIWYEFIDAEEEDFTLFYSSLAEAVTGNLDIKDVSRKKCRVGVTNPDAFVYFRAVAPNTIEYVVALPEEIKEEKYLCEVQKIILN